MIATATAWLADLERFVMPNACLCCGRLVERIQPDGVMCGVCRTRAVALVGGCARCAQPLPPVGPCRFCQDWETLAWVKSGVWLGREARAAVHGLKYSGFAQLGPWMASLIARQVPRPAGAILVPVPLGAARERTRGYNQAALLAQALGAVWRLPVDPLILSRVRETASQIAFDPTARRSNVRGAFKATRAPAVGEAVVLIDDVLTTGATLLAAGAALRASGWPAAGAVTFARALDAGGRISASR